MNFNVRNPSSMITVFAIIFVPFDCRNIQSQTNTYFTCHFMMWKSHFQTKLLKNKPKEYLKTDHSFIIVKVKLFIYEKWMILLLCLGQNFSYLTMLLVKICNILPKRKKYAPNFLYVAKYMKMYQKIIKKLWKCLGKI